MMNIRIERLRFLCRVFLLLWLLAAVALIWMAAVSGALSLASVVTAGLLGAPVGLACLVLVRLIGFAFPAIWRELNRPVDPKALALLTPMGLFAGGVREIRTQARAADRRR